MTWKTKRMSTAAAVIGVVCGAEIVIAIMIGGAGLGALFGWEGLVVAIAVLAVVIGLIRLRQARSHRGQLGGAPPMRAANLGADSEDLLRSRP